MPETTDYCNLTSTTLEIKDSKQIPTLNKKACRGFFLKLGFTPCKAEQPLQGMELQEKETQKD